MKGNLIINNENILKYLNAFPKEILIKGLQTKKLRHYLSGYRIENVPEQNIHSAFIKEVENNNIEIQLFFNDVINEIDKKFKKDLIEKKKVELSGMQKIDREILVDILEIVEKRMEDRFVINFLEIIFEKNEIVLLEADKAFIEAKQYFSEKYEKKLKEKHSEIEKLLKEKILESEKSIKEKFTESEKKFKEKYEINIEKSKKEIDDSLNTIKKLTAELEKQKHENLEFKGQLNEIKSINKKQIESIDTLSKTIKNLEVENEKLAKDVEKYRGIDLNELLVQTKMDKLYDEIIDVALKNKFAKFVDDHKNNGTDKFDFTLYWKQLLNKEKDSIESILEEKIFRKKIDNETIYKIEDVEYILSIKIILLKYLKSITYKVLESNSYKEIFGDSDDE